MRDDVLRSAALKALHDPAYDALWSAAEDLDFSIGIHEGGNSGMPTVGIDRRLIEERILGSQQGMGGIGGVGARQAVRHGRDDELRGGSPWRV
jgi:hypothetical protein